ncbi:mandelate racemase/muconate lactonizing enzyme family protein [Bacillus sp. FJAT-50079]|uniref:mandelate racemase/muconate lactonizing enzyme family protein n=1 Tax=Bacillus sp. FJAT-50079 TaxID=2833577 RepID=UPI001BC9E198|nr:mandelate racemase/muconate lactonizing enzyme family protein [Bacillus sp. FJAT-50079]MBS4206594.1 mandelate racemase/muconate lactonizing enzyme family protein [Bacillus sp. FJAT-50079]
MKVVSFKHRVVSIPVRYPVVSCVRKSKNIVFVLLDVFTDEGFTGISYAQAFHKDAAQAICSCLDYLEPIIKEEDPRNIEKIWYKMLDAIKLLGHQGLPMFALSMIDIALWDILGKIANLPVCRLLGGEPQNFEAYQSDGLWLVSPNEAAIQADEFVSQGYKAIKMRLGRPDLEDDLKAIREIRNVIGENIELIADVNQGWTMETATAMIEKMRSYNLRWVEEPIEANNTDGYYKLVNKMTTSIPIATGENLYGVASFHHFLKKDAASVYTPDLQRTGGITGWKRINTLLEQYNKPSSIHLFPEYAVHLFPVIRNHLKVEWMSWASPLFKERIECKDGMLRTPERAGFGLEWDEVAVSKYKIEM